MHEVWGWKPTKKTALCQTPTAFPLTPGPVGTSFSWSHRSARGAGGREEVRKLGARWWAVDWKIPDGLFRLYPGFYMILYLSFIWGISKKPSSRFLLFVDVSPFPRGIFRFSEVYSLFLVRIPEKQASSHWDLPLARFGYRETPRKSKVGMSNVEKESANLANLKNSLQTWYEFLRISSKSNTFSVEWTCGGKSCRRSRLHRSQVLVVGLGRRLRSCGMDGPRARLGAGALEVAFGGSKYQLFGEGSFSEEWWGKMRFRGEFLVAANFPDFFFVNTNFWSPFFFRENLGGVGEIWWKFTTRDFFNRWFECTHDAFVKLWICLSSGSMIRLSRLLFGIADWHPRKFENFYC